LLRNRNRKDKTEDKEEVDDAVCWGWKQEIAEGVRGSTVIPQVPNHLSTGLELKKKTLFVYGCAIQLLIPFSIVIF